MKLQNKNILLISPEPWDHIFVSKHHYATHLAARGNQVYFLNPPSKQNTVEKTDYENVYSVQYTGFIKGLRFMPAFLQRYLIKQKFEQLQKLCKVKFDMVWSFDNSIFFDFSALPKEVYCISHIVDLNQDFEFEKAAKTADLCLTTTKYILNKQLAINKNAFNIGHGYYALEKPPSKIPLKGINTIKCGYAGNLDIAYLDWDLIKRLLKSFPQVDFIFAGKWTQHEKVWNMMTSSNFHYIGILKAEELAAFYSGCDVLILTYLAELYKEQLANPHKMMEYFGSGKMIIATWTEEYVHLLEDNLIFMAKTKEEYLNYFKESVESLDKWNEKEKSYSRINIALENTYSKQIEKIEKIINSYS